jgi:hypothetical protein
MHVFVQTERHRVFIRVMVFNALYYYIIARGGRRGCDHMVVEFTTTYAASVYHQKRCEFESLSGLGVLDTTLCDKSL